MKKITKTQQFNTPFLQGQMYEGGQDTVEAPTIVKPSSVGADVKNISDLAETESAVTNANMYV